jgi:hypothetical protein
MIPIDEWINTWIDYSTESSFAPGEPTVDDLLHYLCTKEAVKQTSISEDEMIACSSGDSVEAYRFLVCHKDEFHNRHPNWIPIDVSAVLAYLPKDIDRF